ncbi:lysophospholipid acyltransferase family protein [uncultured Phascolarctobacterium sp.]|uniref:lysophospholipid acyltransferase family protein n=1 Tax=uncultured Phascolarctobacterium sp. TaxID=512296 RepID=UPI0026277682|nr:lysophospholipid acyltransferase family protein [uncultured Phascolarctobacterium sp.]
MLAYYIVKFFSWVMCIAPKWLRSLTAAILGGLAVVATPKWRLQMAMANIRECLGVDETRARQIAEQSLRRFGRMVVEVMRFPLLNRENIDQLVKVEGLEYLAEAYKQDKGVIIATGHFGNWELLGATIALHGYPMLSITRKQNNKYMDRFINEYREMVGQKVAYNRGGQGLLAISRILKEKKLLGVLYDQDTNDDGVELDLFGKKSITPLGAAALSRLYGSPILPVFMHNNEDGTCTAKIHPPLYTPKSKDKQQDFYDVTRELIVILEHEIISDPAMWFWVHDRWKDGRERFAAKK